MITFKLECCKCKEAISIKYYETICHHMLCFSCYNIFSTQRKSDFLCPALGCKQPNKLSSIKNVTVKSSEEMELEREKEIRRDLQIQYSQDFK